jgi:hypothetical protein
MSTAPDDTVTIQLGSRTAEATIVDDVSVRTALREEEIIRVDVAGAGELDVPPSALQDPVPDDA